ncbi:TetR family transcriptional regulator, partial [Rhodococcus qingshengii]|nr:TetR family transcriptional regulator [Rhodococcus qingshengii]
ELVLRMVGEGVDRKLFSVSATAETARALLAMCQSIPRWYHAEGELSPQEVARKYAEIALNTVGCKPRRTRTR